jgi:hypothetical protein
MRDIQVKFYVGLSWKKHIKKQEVSLQQIIGLTFKEETRKVLYLDYSFVWW